MVVVLMRNTVPHGMLMSRISVVANVVLKAELFGRGRMAAPGGGHIKTGLLITDAQKLFFLFSSCTYISSAFQFDMDVSAEDPEASPIMHVRRSLGTIECVSLACDSGMSRSHTP
jgi:hypothetical protein